MRSIVVLYDETCGFCTACAAWLVAQPAYVIVECLPGGGAATLARFPDLRRDAGKQELIVVDDRGGVYREGDAWLMTLWALCEYRDWALRLAEPSLRPLARGIFELASRGRRYLPAWLIGGDDETLRRTVERRTFPAGVPVCGGDAACALEPRGLRQAPGVRLSSRRRGVVGLRR